MASAPAAAPVLRLPLPALDEWLLPLRAVLALLFGLLTFLFPDVSTAALLLLFAVFLVADGLAALAGFARALRRRRRKAGWLASGLVNLAAGLVAMQLAFQRPMVSVLAFVMLVAAWAIASGFVMLLAAVRAGAARAWLLPGGLASIAWGLLMFAVPAIGPGALVLWLGLYAMVFGSGLLLHAYSRAA